MDKITLTICLSSEEFDREKLMRMATHAGDMLISGARAFKEGNIDEESLDSLDRIIEEQGWFINLTDLDLPENNPTSSTLPEPQSMYMDNGEGDQIPIADIRSQGGLKKDIVALVNKMPSPDRQCELTDFLGALQHVLDKHGVKV